MKTYFICLSIALFAYHSLTAQIVFSGKLTDEKKAPIPVFNVIILNPSDSSLVAGEVCYSGTFSIKSNLAIALFKIDAVGYHSQYHLINKTTNIGTIALSQRVLNEVEVAAKKLPFEVQNGNMKINVENSIFASSSSAQDILSKSPGIVMTNGEVNVIGSGNALIYIDGKETNLAALQAIPVSQITSIEIIKNPDASYDAEGKAVIIVRLKELGLEGVQGQVNSHYTKGFYQLGFFDMNAQYKKGKWTLSAGANNNFGATGTKRTDFAEVASISNPYTANGTYSEKVDLSNVTNYLFGVKYQLSPKQSLSAQFNGNYSAYDLDVKNNIMIEDSSKNSNLKSVNTAYSLYQTNVISANYSLKIDSLNSQIFVGGTYSQVDISYSDLINESFSTASMTTKTDSKSTGDNKNTIGLTQIDIMKNFKSGQKLKIGGKISQTTSLSSVFLENISGQATVNYRNDAFVYDEEILATYLNYSAAFKKSTYQIGTRLERTNSTAIKNNSDSPYIDTSYWSIFPNASINTSFEKWSTSSVFTSKISRPRYSDITPYIYYINNFISIYGNPNVMPSFNYNFEQKFTYKKTNLSFGYNYTKDPRAFLTFQDSLSESTNAMRVVNVERLDEIYTEVRQPISKGLLYSYNMANLSLSQYKSDVINFGNTKSTPKLYAYSYNKITLKKWFNIEVIGDFTSGFSDGRRQMAAQGQLHFGLSKSFLEEAIFLQITMYDIFQTGKPNQTMQINGNSFQSVTTQDTRFLRVFLSIGFGKLKEADYQHLQLNENEKQRAM
jgi:hypothetical protein